MTDKQAQTLDQLNELWELSGEGDAEWFPNELDLVTTSTQKYWVYGAYEIRDQHALDLVTAEAERWLESSTEWLGRNDWMWPCKPSYWRQGDTGMIYAASLPEALRYATNGGGT